MAPFNPLSEHTGVVLSPGLYYLPGYFDRAAQEQLLEKIRAVVEAAPLFVPRMPRTGKPFSVRMTNCGRLGWVSDQRGGYRYQAQHPDTGTAWPAMPGQLLDCWRELTGYPKLPEAGLINYYGPKARMSLHQDRDEEDLEAPVLSISLGDSGLFRYGGLTRRAPTRSQRLKSGDVIVLSGEARLAYHGVDRIYPRTSDLLKAPGRINVTLRRVNRDASVDTSA